MLAEHGEGLGVLSVVVDGSVEVLSEYLIVRVIALLGDEGGEGGDAFFEVGAGLFAGLLGI